MNIPSYNSFAMKSSELSLYLHAPQKLATVMRLKPANTPNSSDLLQHLPVYDEGSGLTYKNIFCAHCNNRFEFNVLEVYKLNATRKILFWQRQERRLEV